MYMIHNIDVILSKRVLRDVTLFFVKYTTNFQFRNIIFPFLFSNLMLCPTSDGGDFVRDIFFQFRSPKTS